MFINDLPSCSNFFKPTLFADDSSFSVSVKNYPDQIESINNELQHIYDWTIRNRLTINVSKTEMLCFSTKKLNLENNQIILNQQFVSFCDSAVFLGVTFDNNMSFSSHIKNVLLKISKNTGVLYKIKENLTTQAMINFYYALLFPYFSYNIIIWGSTYKTYLEPLIRQQKRIIRIIAGANFLEHCNPLFHRLKILKFEDIYKFFVCVTMFKRMNRNFYAGNHDINTRSRNTVQPPFQRLTLTQHSFEYCGPKIWAEIPSSIQNITKISTFKRKLKMYLIDQYHD